MTNYQKLDNYLTWSWTMWKIYSLNGLITLRKEILFGEKNCINSKKSINSGTK